MLVPTMHVRVHRASSCSATHKSLCIVSCATLLPAGACRQAPQATAGQGDSHVCAARIAGAHAPGILRLHSKLADVTMLCPCVGCAADGGRGDHRAACDRGAAQPREATCSQVLPLLQSSRRRWHDIWRPGGEFGRAVALLLRRLSSARASDCCVFCPLLQGLLAAVAASMAGFLGQEQAAQFAKQLWSFLLSGLTVAAYDRLVFGAAGEQQGEQEEQDQEDGGGDVGEAEAGALHDW